MGSLHEGALTDRNGFFHEVIEQWLQDPDITLACGQWSDAAVSELIPAQNAHILPPKYEGQFAGIRELQMADAPHHIHLDLGRIHTACYTVVPSVCLGFRPSFELRFLATGAGGAPTSRCALTVMISQPYSSQGLLLDRIARFFDRALTHLEQCPQWVEVSMDPSLRASDQGQLILTALRSLPATPHTRSAWEVLQAPRNPAGHLQTMQLQPPCLELLKAALALPDASLVIYRERTLVEFKTEKLDGVHCYTEEGHVSWQIGGLHEHHCHLDLLSVKRMLFSAESVPCQGGGLNYTLWFLTAGPSGNPWRRDGYFSVTLNCPYKGDDPRMEVIGPMLALYERFRHAPGVEADTQFLQVLETGAPHRYTQHAHA